MLGKRQGKGEGLFGDDGARGAWPAVPISNGHNEPKIKRFEGNEREMEAVIFVRGN